MIAAPERSSSSSELLERDAELSVLSAAVAGLARGEGAVVILEAAGGLGKTALLDRAALLARGCDVRRAAPGPLERGFPYGVVRALLETRVRSRPEMAVGAAGRLLLGDDVSVGPDVGHSLFWLCSALAAERPLVLVVDDAQWADRPSLEALCYLAGRIRELPMLLAVAARAGDPDAPGDLLSLLGGDRVLRPAPLGVWSAVALIRREAPGTPLRSCREAHLAAGGSPWLLTELARDGAPAPAFCDDVRRRLAGLAPPARAVAGALAVLGDAAPPPVLAGLAGVGAAELAHARAGLRAAGLLAGATGRFAHELIAAAVRATLPPPQRDRLHREAASLIAAAGADGAAVAAHLMACEPAGDPEASGLLLQAAAQAAPAEAVAYFERALAEGAPCDDRLEIRARLALAAFEGELPDARRLLYDALGGPHDAELLTCLAGLQALTGGDDGLADRLEAVAGGDPAAGAAVAADAGAAAGTGPAAGGDPALAAAALDVLERPRRVALLAALAPREPALARVVLAHRAWAAVEDGSRPARECAAMALEALAHGVLLAEAGRRAAYHLCVRTLLATDRFAEAERAIDALRGRSLCLDAAASAHAAELALRTGDLPTAERAARAALDGGAFAATARDVLAERSPDDYERAYADAVAAGAEAERLGLCNPAAAPWRSAAAQALAHLGRRAEAAALAAEELARAERFGARGAIGTALLAGAVAEPDAAARVALCRRALPLAAGFDALRIRIELGAGLSRLGARIEAREHLRPALAAADAAGAARLAERARRELVATGLRPRQAALEGAGALTPRQRQICALAAAGKGNRDIAHALFLSVKTVETHLAAAYRKLGIRAREDIAPALAA